MVSLALAGKPNAGKSTFFEAATLAEVEVANYPFTTIDPNHGVTHARTACPCLERDHRCDAEGCLDGKRYVPVELIDVAGLVPGAHEGRGLGNQFLDALMNADAILHVVDASGGTDEEGEPLETGSRDPADDLGFVEEELDLWLAGIVDRNWEGIERQSRSPHFNLEAAITDMVTGLGVSEAEVGACLRVVEYPTDPREWTDEHRRALARVLRRRTKPIVVVANKVDIARTDAIDSLNEAADVVVPATAAGERALRRAAEQGVVEYDPGDDSFSIVGDVTDEQRRGLDDIAAVMTEHGGTGVQTAINTAVYDVLDLLTVYPVENETRWTDGADRMLPDAFLLPAGSTPPDLAYRVHTDIGEGYVHAVDARTGRDIGEAHELDEGDVIKIVSTA